MSGVEESKSPYVDNKVKDFEAQIESLEKHYGLSNIYVNPEIENILSYTWNDLDCMTPEECSKTIHSIYQYGLSVQVKINRYKSLKAFCMNALNLVIAGEYEQYKQSFTPSDITKYIIIKNNSYAYELNKYVQKYEMNIQMFENMIHLIESISNTFRNMSYIKKNEGNFS